MANKVRVMGITFDPNEEYKGNVVIAALNQSYQNGVTAGKREVEAQAFASINRARKTGYAEGAAEGAADLVELARLLKKILREVND